MSDQTSRPTVSVQVDLRETLYVPHFNTAAGKIEEGEVTITLRHEGRPAMIAGANVLGGDPVAVLRTDLVGAQALREALDAVLRRAGAA